MPSAQYSLVRVAAPHFLLQRLFASQCITCDTPKQALILFAYAQAARKKERLLSSTYYPPMPLHPPQARLALLHADRFFHHPTAKLVTPLSIEIHAQV